MSYFWTKDGCRLFFEFYQNDRTKHKPVIVFLNGFLQTALHWKYQVETFQDVFQVLTYDARSQGKSDLGDLPLTLDQHAQDLGDLLSFLKINNAHFIGISLGAKIALSFAEHSPQKVNSLTLCSIAMETSDRMRQIFQTAKSLLEDKGTESMAEYLLPFLSASFYLMKNQRVKKGMANAFASRNKKESLLAQLKAMQSYPDMSKVAFPLHVPILMISGADDRMIDEAATKRLTKHLGADWERIKDVGHSIPFETPDMFNQIISRFIAS